VLRNIGDPLAGDVLAAVCPDLFWRIEPGIDITGKTEAEWRKAFGCFKAFNVDKGVAGIASAIAWMRAQGRRALPRQRRQSGQQEDMEIPQQAS